VHRIHDLSRLRHQVGFGQGFADLHAGCEHEGVGDSTADDQLIHLLRQLRQHGELGGHLGPADDCHQRTARVFQRLAERLQLAREQRAGAGDRRILGHAVGGRLRAMRGGEGVVHVDVAQRRDPSRQRIVVLLLALVEAAVLQQRGAAGGDVDPIQPAAHQRNVLTEQLGQAPRHRGQRFLLVELALGRTPEMRHQHQPCIPGQRVLDAGQGGADARVVADDPVFERHVEILAHQHPLAGEIEVGHLQDGHAGYRVLISR
jgi:hypothetical protein